MSNQTTNRWTLLLDLFQSYGVLVGSVLVGLALYFLKPDWISSLEPWGETYFNLLKMWALPIMMTSLILAVSQFWRQGTLQTKMQSIAFFSLASLVTIFVSISAASLFLEVGQDLDNSSLRQLGGLISQREQPLRLNFSSDNLAGDQPMTLVGFFASIIPDNIFAALTDDTQSIQVVCFALLFGLALGWSRALKDAFLPSLLEQVYEVMTQITEWVGLFVPFGLCIQVASIAQRSKWSDFVAMRNFITMLMLFFCLTSVISVLVIWRRSRLPLSTVMSALGESSLLVLSSQDGVTAIPSSIIAFKGVLGFDRETVDLVIPTAITMFRVGSFVYLVSVVFFISGLYSQDPSFTDLMVIISGVALCSTASSTATGGDDLILLLVPVLSILDLPLEAILFPLVAIDLLLQPFRELSTVHAGMALTALMATPQSKTP
ncbi:MAG: cation:dicarboxylase symporter family transporter [Prochlorothrix sp.]|nr:cation:dicarboxylase symporter family transporter [Prochlorothrix sp.]